MAHNVYTTINSWYWPTSLSHSSICRVFWLPWKDMGHFLWKFTLGNCFILHVTCLSKIHFRSYARPLDSQHSTARCSTANIFSAGKKKEKTVKLVSSGGNYQYQWALIFLLLHGRLAEIFEIWIWALSLIYLNKFQLWSSKWKLILETAEHAKIWNIFRSYYYSFYFQS